MKVDEIERRQKMQNDKYEVAKKCRKMIDEYLAKVPKDDREEVEQEIQTLIFDEP